jgi:hypothetical protein
VSRAKELRRVRSKQQRALAGRKLSGCVRGEVEMLDEKGSPGQLSRVDFAAVHGSTLAGRASQVVTKMLRSVVHGCRASPMRQRRYSHYITQKGTNLLELSKQRSITHRMDSNVMPNYRLLLVVVMRMKLRLARHMPAPQRRNVGPPAPAPEADERPQQASC